MEAVKDQWLPRTGEKAGQVGGAQRISKAVKKNDFVLVLKDIWSSCGDRHSTEVVGVYDLRAVQQSWEGWAARLRHR